MKPGTRHNITLPDVLNSYNKQIFSVSVREKDKGRGSGGIINSIKDGDNIEINVIENTHFWIKLEIKISSYSLVLGTFYLRPNLNDDVCIQLLYNTLCIISEIFVNTDIIFLCDFKIYKKM